MQPERRTESKRIDVSRPVELLDREGAEITTGFTRNLCEGGLRARVDELTGPKSANILVRLYLEDGREPVVKPARIVWCARDLYGEGAEVGLRLVGSEEDDREGTGSAPPEATVAARVLAEGQQVQVDAGGLLLTATVTAIEAPDAAGNLRVTMKLVDGDALQDEFDPEEWKARPIRDAMTGIRRYARPVLRFVALALAAAGRVLAPVARRLWALVPAGPRGRIERFLAGMVRSRVVLAAWRLGRSAARSIARRALLAHARLAAWWASRMALRAGD